MTTVDRLLETSGLTIEQAALRASLPYERMLAIAELFNVAFEGF